jgi:hypothetical protein
MEGTGTQWRASTNVNEENDMKRLLTTAVFLSIVATPAFAQSYNPELGTGNVGLTVPNGYGEAAYAEMPYTRESRGNEYGDPRAVRRMNPSYKPDYDSEGTYRR